ncbi:6213_t:CDS:2 [Paraglomus brasilianum]|uniref:6213_t:CDS:1 n=1 Tax=Paraglomus brasilianum TaxID=144538 RepID=A0A9N9BDI3_9GLOM|nr:6213_t:CDS:2 [Paraglomus brasilianum]
MKLMSSIEAFVENCYQNKQDQMPEKTINNVLRANSKKLDSFINQPSSSPGNKVKEAQKMAKGVIDFYALLLSDFFNLSSPFERFTRIHLFRPFRLGRRLLFLTKIVMEMCECVNDINVAAEASVALSTLMEQTRWRFVEVLCDTWIMDAKNFYLLEDRTLDPDYYDSEGLSRIP